MDFKFLPQLPKSNLDDRTFKDLVDECVLRIPRYCPEWTNYNPSDPGITLIELFAWLTDQMLLRFNQVPRRNYIAFLELLGIRLKAPEPARTAITFYLTRPQSSHDRIPAIPAGTEVATERSETEEAIIFSTDREALLGVPLLRHFLTSDVAHEALDDQLQRQQLEAIANLRERDNIQQGLNLRDRFANNWREEEDRWSGREQPVFRQVPEPGNSFYLVFDSNEQLDGNVIEVTIEGQPATTTGIDPRHPPRRWEAWDGFEWQPILRQESDDKTFGFSFDEDGVGSVGTICSASIRLHLPLQWPALSFSGYRGRWLRCVYQPPAERQAGYRYPPQVTALSAQTLGVSAPITQAERITNELLGESDGKPGQGFQLRAGNVLPRQPGEHLEVTLPGMATVQVWTEVTDFSDSRATDLHYTLDATSGQIQFGPLIREPSHLREAVGLRRQVQTNGLTPTANELDSLEMLEHQYGAIPPRGSILRMAAYRTGGGRRGNVQQETIKILKSSIPYVSGVSNDRPAQDGADAESLDEAVLRVPRMLRTCNRAVTPEDYETLSLQANRAIARAFCPRSSDLQNQPGTVKLYLVPQASPRDQEQGLSPDRLRLHPDLRQDVQAYLDERRLLGTEVKLLEPDYVGVAIQAELSLLPESRSRQSQEDLRRKLLQSLYDFLNPLTGNRNGQGWDFGQRLYKADVMGLLQRHPEVRYLENLELFKLEPPSISPAGIPLGVVAGAGPGLGPAGPGPGPAASPAASRRNSWERRLAPEGFIDLQPNQLICSWVNDRQPWGHVIRFVEEQTP